jgi:hypothetical protein
MKWLFSPSRSAYQKALEKYTEALLASKPDLQRFSRLFPYLLVKTMKLNKASVALFDRGADVYRLYSEPESGPRVIDRNSALVQELMRTKAEFLSLSANDHSLHSELRDLDSVLVIPAFSPEQILILLFNLGAPSSGKDFYQDDIRFLKKWADRVVTRLPFPNSN